MSDPPLQYFSCIADWSIYKEREEDPNVRGDAFKTLFVARLSYDTTEKDLEREFGRFGPIERVRYMLCLKLEISGDLVEASAIKH